MKRMRKYRSVSFGRRAAGLAVALAAFVAVATGTRAQSSVTPQSINSGGDTREGAFGLFFSTIGEPIASDSVSVSDDQSTWTGFWQVMPVEPSTGGVDVAWGAHFAEGVGVVAVAPNPFAHDLTIELEIPATGMVDVGIFDLTGERVETLMSGRHESGGYRLHWIPEQLTPGTYVVVMLVNGVRTPARLITCYR